MSVARCFKRSGVWVQRAFALTSLQHMYSRAVSIVLHSDLRPGMELPDHLMFGQNCLRKPTVIALERKSVLEAVPSRAVKSKSSAAVKR